MKFVVYSRGTMMSVPAANKAWALISICENGDFPVVNTNEHHKDTLKLKFHDVDRETPRDLNNRILFDIAHAQAVLRFYEQMKEAGVEIMFIHCAMGMCRSPAIAAVLQKIETNDDHIWFATKRPNMLVYRTLYEEAGRRGLLGSAR